MRNLQLVLFILIVLFSNSIQPFAQTKVENPLTLELTFGDEGLPDEYLLAQPRFIVVDDESNILVFDESRIKMYDSNGNPVKIIGGPGQGPGEFGNMIFHMFIAPSGYITVQERTGFSLFSPDKEFIEKRRFSNLSLKDELEESYKITFPRIGRNSSEFYFLNENEFIISSDDINRDNYNDEGEYFNYLFLKKSGKLNMLIKYRNTNTVVESSGRSYGSSRRPILGTFRYALLPGGKIVYTHTSLENKYKNDKGFLTFKVINMEGSHLNTFVYEYKLVKIENSYVENYQGGADNPKANKMRKLLREKKFEAPITHFKADGDYIFLLTYRKIDENSSIYEIETFNTDTGEHVSSFQTATDIPFIKDGYYYLLKYGSDDSFPVVEKYKIDPAVYGK